MMMHEKVLQGSEVVRGIGRLTMVGVMGVCLLCGIGAPKAFAGTPTDSMKGTIDEVLRIIRDKELKEAAKAEARRSQLEKAVAERFDYREMSLRALGAPWKNLSEQEKQEFVTLFQDLLISAYAKQIETYKGEGVKYLDERTYHSEQDGKDYAEVRTKILLEKTELPVDYRLIHGGANWHVYDVIMANTSLVQNYQKQFHSLLRKKSYPDLVEHLRETVNKLKSP